MGREWVSECVGLSMGRERKREVILRLDGKEEGKEERK